VFGEVIVRREENRDLRDGSIENDEIRAMRGCSENERECQKKQ